MKHEHRIGRAYRMALLACAASLAACATGPHYAGPPPQPVLDKGFVNAPSTATVQAAALETWWTQLGDPTLDALIADTLAHNPDLDIAAARLRQARAQRRIVRADGLPSLSADGLAQRQSFSENIDLGFGQGGGQQGQGGQGGRRAGRRRQLDGGQQGGGFDASQIGTGGAAIDFFQASFDVAWEVDLFGATRAKVNASDAEVEAAAFGVEDVRTSIAAEVARDYLVVREVQARLDLTRSTLAIARRTQALAREQERAGLVTEADTARTDAQVLAVETTVPQLELLELQARQRLAVLAGREPSALAATLAPVRPIPLAQAPVAAGMPAELLLRRPDLRMAERHLAAATHFEAGAVRDLYPKLSLSGAGGVQADTVGDLFDWSSRFFRLTANLTAPRRGRAAARTGRRGGGALSPDRPGRVSRSGGGPGVPRSECPTEGAGRTHRRAAPQGAYRPRRTIPRRAGRAARRAHGRARPGRCRDACRQCEGAGYGRLDHAAEGARRRVAGSAPVRAAHKGNMMSSRIAVSLAGFATLATMLAACSDPLDDEPKGQTILTHAELATSYAAGGGPATSGAGSPAAGAGGSGNDGGAVSGSAAGGVAGGGMAGGMPAGLVGQVPGAGGGGAAESLPPAGLQTAPGGEANSAGQSGAGQGGGGAGGGSGSG